jgi:hypothetical protein
MLQAARYLLGSPGASGFGSKSTAEDVTAACPDLGAVTAVITGATSGIGAETARVLAKRGARVVIPARSVKAAEDVRARIRAECPAADVLVLPLDLSSLASVRAFAGRFLGLGLPLHLLMYVRRVASRPFPFNFPPHASSSLWHAVYAHAPPIAQLASDHFLPATRHLQHILRLRVCA